MHYDRTTVCLHTSFVTVSFRPEVSDREHLQRYLSDRWSHSEITGVDHETFISGSVHRIDCETPAVARDVWDSLISDSRQTSSTISVENKRAPMPPSHLSDDDRARLRLLYQTRETDGWHVHDNNGRFSTRTQAVEELNSVFDNSAVTTAALLFKDKLRRQLLRRGHVDLLLNPRTFVLTNQSQ